jgi:hypothetical protein
MQLTSFTMDKAAVGLSLMCVAHCLLTPIAIVLLPAFGAIFLEDERFHFVLLFLVLPTSLLALTIGCRKHLRVEIALIGLAGLLILFSVVIIGEESLGKFGEKATTVFGALIIAFAHIRNFMLCLRHDCNTEENFCEKK